jgi:hypothetical protein
MDDFPVVIYNSAFSGTQMKKIGCTLTGIIGMSKNFASTISQRGYYGDQEAIFELSFIGQDQMIGVDFLLSCLSGSAWDIRMEHERDFFSSGATDVTISCPHFNESSEELLLRLINNEINTNPKWLDYIDRFILSATDYEFEFVKIK